MREGNIVSKNHMPSDHFSIRAKIKIFLNKTLKNWTDVKFSQKCAKKATDYIINLTFFANTPFISYYWWILQYLPNKNSTIPNRHQIYTILVSKTLKNNQITFRYTCWDGRTSFFFRARVDVDCIDDSNFNFRIPFNFYQILLKNNKKNGICASTLLVLEIAVII